MNAGFRRHVDKERQTWPVWPEIGTYVKVSDRMRFYVLAATVHEDGDSTEGEFGAN